MCGICGVVNSQPIDAVPPEGLAAMNGRIVHRGPDDEGFYMGQGIGLAMRRLSIIDLATGHQPISNEDGTLWIVYNGETYNHAQLRLELEARGHQYRTQSDTETILHLYEEYGRDSVSRLRGMFAFAIWDERRRRLFAARDRLGIKPFYYLSAAGRFLFASEIKALLAYPGVRAALNQAAIPEYLAFGYLSGEESMFSGILKLPPGHTLELEQGGKPRVERYWDLGVEVDEPACPKQYYVDGYREQLEQAVSTHLMSDVPLGVFLSGGLDSSAVAALATRIRKSPLQTFSVGYGEQAFSELGYAQEVADYLGSEHHEVVVSRQDFFDALPFLIWHEDEPLAWPSSVSLYFVARLARKHVTVVLTGEGSDETLGGYSRYAWTLWNMQYHTAWQRLTPAALRQLVRVGIASGPLGSGLRRKLGHTFLARNGEDWTSFYFDNFYSAFSLGEQQSLLCDPFPGTAATAYNHALYFWNQSSGDLFHRLLYTDIKTYLVKLLMKQDTMSMAASVESRVPFLDHGVVEFAARIPASFSVKGLAGKQILKQAVEDLLPKSIIYRKKMGFPTPWSGWLNGAGWNDVRELVLSPRSFDRGLFRRDAVERLLAEHRAGHVDHSNRIWRVLNLELWMRVFMDGEKELHRPSGQAANRVHPGLDSADAAR
jgi:asparagine synthase (glutamine-hydrolysing)